MEDNKTVNVVAFMLSDTCTVNALKEDLDEMGVHNKESECEGSLYVIAYCIEEDDVIKLAERHGVTMLMNTIYNFAENCVNYRVFNDANGEGDYVLSFNGKSDCTNLPEWKRFHYFATNDMQFQED